MLRGEAVDDFAETLAQRRFGLSRWIAVSGDADDERQVTKRSLHSSQRIDSTFKARDFRGGVFETRPRTKGSARFQRRFQNAWSKPVPRSCSP